MSIKLGVVSQKVFDCCADALALYAVDVVHCHSRSEKGIFAEVFKVSTVHRRAVDVHARSEQKVNAFRARIASEFPAYKLCQSCVPTGSQSNTTGKSSGRSEVTNTYRTVRHFQPGQIE